jgi:hypothetical protein
MKVLKFTATIPEKYRWLAYTEAVNSVLPNWGFVETFGYLIAHNKIQGLIRNINEDFFVESYYFVEDEDFKEVRDHIDQHLSVFNDTIMPFTTIDNLNLTDKEMLDLINTGNHEVQIINPERFNKLINIQ